jgi:putative ABC transport system permease protein
MSPAVPTWAGVAASAALAAPPIIVAWRARLNLAGDILIAALRAAVQLVAVGAVLLLLFRRTGLVGATGWLAAVVLLAGFVAAGRARGFPHALTIAIVAVAVATAATLGALLVFGVIAAQARVVIPVGGMVVSTAMLSTALVLNRSREEARTARPAIEARLALGLSAADAFAPHQRTTLRTALIASIDPTKVVGLISLPGAMTGLILAGVNPLTAIRYQIVVTYMQLAAATLAGLVAARLAEGALFDNAHRLRHLTSPARSSNRRRHRPSERR